MTDRDLLRYRVALSMLPIHPKEVVAFLASGRSEEEFFSLRDTDDFFMSRRSARLINLLGKRDDALQQAEKEVRFIEDHNIRPHFITDKFYPVPLAGVSRPPLMLYSVGADPASYEHYLAIVGTRQPTPRGEKFCADVVRDLASKIPGLCIVSGLAYGIDAAAHRAAIDAGVATIAVVAHGLDTVYPASHRHLAKDIAREHGAILTAYPSGTRPLRGHFLERNSVIAAVAHGTLVVESGIRGGALSTAATAAGIDREVMAVPGRPTDEMSAGCNNLIRRQKAVLVQSAADIVKTMGWEEYDFSSSSSDASGQPSLFPALEGDCLTCWNAMKDYDEIDVDSLISLTNLPVHALMAALSDLEFEGLISRQPGGRFVPLK